MRPTIFATGTAVAAAALLLTAAPAAAQDFRWDGVVEPGDVLEVKGVNGSVTARTASGREARVTAEKRGEDDDPSTVRVEVVEHARGVTICAVYPSRPGRRANECAPGDAGHMGSHDNDVRVTFEVEVPGGVRFRGHTVNGDVRASDLTADVQAETVNGSIDFRTRGSGTARTVNGSIDAAIGAVDAEDRLAFETVNGRISLELPEGIAADVEAETVNGSMHTDFPLTVQGRWSPRRITGTLGDGGADLRLKTVNGSISLRRAGV